MLVYAIGKQRFPLQDLSDINHMVGGNHLGLMETEGHAGSIPVISEIYFYFFGSL